MARVGAGRGAGGGAKQQDAPQRHIYPLPPLQIVLIHAGRRSRGFPFASQLGLPLKLLFFHKLLISCFNDEDTATVMNAAALQGAAANHVPYLFIY